MLDSLRLTLTPADARLAAECLTPLLRTFESRQLATFGTTAVPLLQACLLQPGGPWRGLLIRKERKSHGANRLVEGIIDPAQPVVLVDDTLATGESVFRAVDALLEEGVDVEGVVCLVRYGAGGVSRVEERGVRVEAVLDLEDDLLPRMPEGVDLGPLNPTKWFDWPPPSAKAPEDLSPSALARLAIETWLRDGTMPRPPRRVRPLRDSRGGVYVSLRRRDAIHDRLARDGYWTFPGETAWPTPEGIIRAAVQTARRFTEGGSDATTLADCAIAVTCFGPLIESAVGELDNARFGIVVRSLLRQRTMGGALPNMPGLRNTFQQFRHAHTRNAQLYDEEPYVLYRHTLEKDSDEGTDWQPTGVPGTKRSPVPERALLDLARRALELVTGAPSKGRAPRLPAVEQLFLSVYVDGALRGCVGADVTDGEVNATLETLAAEVWRDRRFGRQRRGSIAVTVSTLWGGFKTDVADVEFMSKPFRLGEQCLEVLQGERRALLLPSVPLTHDLDALEYTQALVEKAGITGGDLYWTRFECDTALASASRPAVGPSRQGERASDPALASASRPAVGPSRQGERASDPLAISGPDASVTCVRLRHGLPPIDPDEPWEQRRTKLLRLATSYLREHHRAKGPIAGTYRPFADEVQTGLDPARVAFVAWQKARVGLRRQAVQDLRRVHQDRSVPVLAFRLLCRLELGGQRRAAVADALALLESIDAFGRFDLGDEAQDADLDYAPGQALLALEAALRRGLVRDPFDVVPRAVAWSLRRYRLNHSHGAGPWLMQALVAFGRLGDARELATETLRFQSRSDGAFLTGQQDDCPGCTSLPPLEGLAALYRTRPTARLRRALVEGTRFIDALVYQEKDVALLPNPRLALGGVRQSHVSGQVRLDFVGHLVNFLLGVGA
ncbi:MAG: AMMECR1 domain-containing protein [Myxococcaceae bacterium]|nr:AMMECR1 domain-containing protein [Myxococcaceae bacterium]